MLRIIEWGICAQGAEVEADPVPLVLVLETIGSRMLPELWTLVGRKSIDQHL